MHVEDTAREGSYHCGRDQAQVAGEEYHIDARLLERRECLLTDLARRAPRHGHVADGDAFLPRPRHSAGSRSIHDQQASSPERSATLPVHESLEVASRTRREHCSVHASSPP